MRNGITLLMLGVASLLPADAGAQQMDYLARQRIEAAVTRLSDPFPADTLEDDAAAIMAGVGLAWSAPVALDATAQAFVPEAGAVIEMVDIRLLLTQIAIQAGARGHGALVRAQETDDREVILLRGGRVTLTELLSLSQGTPAQDFITETPDGILLTRPLAIWSDSGLALDETDHLILDRPSGSFVANLGWLDLSGGTIVGNNGSNMGEPAFQPFVLTAGRGSFTARSATFRALGFGVSAVFGGISVVNNGLIAPSITSAIMDSTLNDVATLGLIGTSGAILSGNRIAASAGTAVLISGAQDSVIAGNKFSALTGPQTIRVTAGASDVRISGNLLSGTARMGILIDRDSRGVTIAGNLVLGNLKTGIGVDAATCISILDNLVAANGGAGISLTDTDGTIAVNNAILFNHGSGVLLRDQATDALVRLSDNVLIGNRDGFRGATPGNLTLEGNDLFGQLPRVFAGDLTPLTVDWLRNRRKAVPVSIRAPSLAPCVQQGND